MAQTATPDEAAAIAAAIARFDADTASVPADTTASVSPWQRAALVEGVGAKETIQDSQGGARWQS